jgi:hypothetical protein
MNRYDTLCASHASHSDSLYNLASSLGKLFGKTASMTDLEEDILLHRASLSFRSIFQPNRLESLNGLACALWEIGIVLKRQAQ